MMFSLVLFVHVTGVLAMFAGLALEAFGGESSAQTTARISGLGAALTLLSGFYMGARMGVLGAAWMLASYGAIAAIIAAGTLVRRSDALHRTMMRVRATFALTIVFLMVARPDAVVSSIVLAVAVGVATLVALPIGVKQPSGQLSAGA
jgi:hypothetical protein